tara:strand:+ start:782 stop:1168 length:387 start_codon:yes stop_codon:yes gene_type:complete
MEEESIKEKSKGFGDTIAKLTHATGLDKVADKIAKMAGKEDCGCGRRREILNELLPYTSTEEPLTPRIDADIPDELDGEYLVLEEIHLTLDGIGPTILGKGSNLTIYKEHPLYKDVPFYIKKHTIKKL